MKFAVDIRADDIRPSRTSGGDKKSKNKKSPFPRSSLHRFVINKHNLVLALNNKLQSIQFAVVEETVVEEEKTTDHE
jgi:hypothetical protein